MREELVGVWSDLGDAVKEPPRFVIEGVLPCGVVFMAGPPKSQKTTLEMALALLVAGYKNVSALPPEMSKVVRDGRVLIMSAEHTAGELRYMVEDGMDISVPNDKSILIADDPWSFRLDDPDAVETLLHWLEQFKPKMMVIDPLVDFHAVDEKEGGAMNRLLRPLQKWFKENDACLLILHHTAKKKQDDKGTYKAAEMRGTGALFGIADGVIMITPMDDGVIHLDCTLKRGAPWQRAIKVGIWGQRGGSAAEQATNAELNEAVFAKLKEGVRNYEVIAKACKVGKAKVVTAIKELKAAGRVTIDHKRNLKVVT